MVWLYLRGAGTTNRISLLQWDVAPIAEAIAQLPDMTAVQVSPIATLTVYFKPGSRSSGMTVRVHALEALLLRGVLENDDFAGVGEGDPIVGEPEGDVARSVASHIEDANRVSAKVEGAAFTEFRFNPGDSIPLVLGPQDLAARLLLEFEVSPGVVRMPVRIPDVGQ